MVREKGGVDGVLFFYGLLPLSPTCVVLCSG